MIAMKLYGPTFLVPGGPGLNPSGTDDLGAYVDIPVSGLRGPATSEKPIAIPDDAEFFEKRADGSFSVPVGTGGTVRFHDGGVLCWRHADPPVPSWVA